MISFSQIPTEFTEQCLTGYQKKGVEIKYHVYTEVKEKKDKQINEVVRLADELNMSEDGIRMIISRLKKSGVKF